MFRFRFGFIREAEYLSGKLGRDIYYFQLFTELADSGKTATSNRISRGGLDQERGRGVDEKIRSKCFSLRYLSRWDSSGRRREFCGQRALV